MRWIRLFLRRACKPAERRASPCGVLFRAARPAVALLLVLLLGKGIGQKSLARDLMHAVPGASSPESQLIRLCGWCRSVRGEGEASEVAMVR
jgi:hypothetical protein